MWHGDIRGVLLRLEGTEGSERRGDFSKKADDRGRKDQGGRQDRSCITKDAECQAKEHRFPHR